jgi:hypothetical protein
MEAGRCYARENTEQAQRTANQNKLVSCIQLLPFSTPLDRPVECTWTWLLYWLLYWPTKAGGFTGAKPA